MVIQTSIGKREKKELESIYQRIKIGGASRI